jgi:transposase-like protein
MRLGQRNHPIQTFAVDRANDAFADGIGHRRARWRFEYADAEFCDRFVEVPSEYTVAIMKQVVVSIIDDAGRQPVERGKRIRRQWTARQKRQMVREAQTTGSVIQAVAQHHGVHVSVLNRWSTEQRVAASGAKKAVNTVRLLPVRVCRARPSRTPSRPLLATIAPDAIEVESSSGRCVYVRGVVDLAGGRRYGSSQRHGWLECIGADGTAGEPTCVPTCFTGYRDKKREYGMTESAWTPPFSKSKLFSLSSTPANSRIVSMIPRRSPEDRP